MRKVSVLTGLGGKLVLPAVFAITAGCLLSVASARASVATWSNWSANPQAATIANSGPMTAGSFRGNATGSGSVSVMEPGAGGNTAGTIHSGGSYMLQAPAPGGNTLNTRTFTITLTFATGGGAVSDIYMSYIRGSSAISPTTITWAVSGIGSSGSIATTTLSGTAWTAVDLSLTSLKTTGTSLVLTGTFSGGTGTGTAGSIGFDDIQVTAVPEPTNYALAGFGLMFVGVGVGRSYFGRRRSTTAG